MVPKDKFGNPIYSHIFKKLVEIGNQLIKLGYKESYNKPNLFYKKIESDATLIIFLDMRGTDVIKIWEEPMPMIYQKVESGEDWQIGRTVKKEIGLLQKNNVPFRFSFEGMLHGSNIDEDFVDGYCKICKKDMMSNAEFCSENCEKEFDRLQQIEWKKERIEREKLEKEEQVKRKLEKEEGNKLIFSNGIQKQISFSIKEEYYNKYFKVNMTNKQAIRYLRERLIKEGYLGYRKFCETQDCYNYTNQIHEDSYDFEDLFKQENYKSLCIECHAKLHKKMRTEGVSQKIDNKRSKMKSSYGKPLVSYGETIKNKNLNDF